MDALTNCLTPKDLNSQWLSRQIDFIGEPWVISFYIDSFVCFLYWLGYHPTDAKLLEVADTLRQQFPESDIVRSGGDEFMAIIDSSNVNQDKLLEVIASLRDSNFVDHEPAPVPKGVVGFLKRCFGQNNSKDLGEPPAFTISCCARLFEEPTTIENLLSIDRKNNKTISDHRHQNVRINERQCKHPQGLVGLALIV